MAIYHLTAKIIGRKAGQSSIACAAYRSGEEIEDIRTREIHHYGRVERVAHTEILAPADAPVWAKSRAQLWNEVEGREKRKDAQLAREFEVALPRELSLDQQCDLLRKWVAAEITSAGAVADIAIHVDKNAHNPHAHIMTTMRAVSADGWGAQKLRQWEDRSALAKWRESWATHTNRALERAGIDERIDHRSHADRGIEEEPTIKEGWAARRRVEIGLDCERVARNHEIRVRNLRLRERAAKVAAAIKEKAKAVTKVATQGVSSVAESLRDTVRQRAVDMMPRTKPAVGQNRDNLDHKGPPVFTRGPVSASPATEPPAPAVEAPKRNDAGIEPTPAPVQAVENDDDGYDALLAAFNAGKGRGR